MDSLCLVYGSLFFFFRVYCFIVVMGLVNSILRYDAYYHFNEVLGIDPSSCLEKIDRQCNTFRSLCLLLKFHCSSIK